MEKKRQSKDVIIIGGGVAGLTAALYVGRMNLDVLVLESELVGGQIINAYGIENYPGFASIKGSELVETVQKQAEEFGAVIDEFDKIKSVELTGKIKIIETESYIYETKVVIIASGMTRRKLPVDNEAKYLGKGIHYCELCDGHMYQDKTIAVVGGGNAAVDAANFLTKYAKKLYLIQRSDILTADDISQEKLKQHSIVEFLFNSEIKSLQGEESLEAISIYNRNEQKEIAIPVDGVFVNIGVVPNTDMFKGVLEIDESGHIIAVEDCRTNLPGVFAAGDVRTKLIRQLTTAAADGTIAALLSEKYLESLKEEK